MMTFPVRIDLPRMPWHPTLRAPAPEKYPSQRQAFRRGAWAGDGVPVHERARVKEPKAERRDNRTRRIRSDWAECEGDRREFLWITHLGSNGFN